MADDENQERYYTSPGDIYGVLRSLKAERSTVNIQFDNKGDLHSTLVLEASIREKAFILDELPRRQDNEAITAGTPFSLRGSLNGIRIYANGLRARQVIRRESGVSYVVPFPEKMLYLQRREAFRAKVPAGMKIHARCLFPDRKPLEGLVLNLSATGFQVSFPGQIKPALRGLERFQVTIGIPQQEVPFGSTAQLIFSEYDPDKKQTRCGCRFVDLKRPDQIIINRFVTQLQREIII